MEEEKEKSKGSRISRIKNLAILLFLALAVGFAAGYYFGYDIGFEKAARILVK